MVRRWPQGMQDAGDAIQNLVDTAVGQRCCDKPRNFAVERVVVAIEEKERVGSDQLPAIVDKIQPIQKGF